MGRFDEARAALEKLSASDSGIRWRAVIAAEQARVAAGVGAGPEAEQPATLPLAHQASQEDAATDGRAAA